MDVTEQREPSREGSERRSHRPPGRSPHGSHFEGQRSAGTSAAEHGSRSDEDTQRPLSADPVGRLVGVTRSSLAGSLRLVSTAIRGMGDVVCQAGDVAEGLAGGTGQVAGNASGNAIENLEVCLGQGASVGGQLLIVVIRKIATILFVALMHTLYLSQ